MFVPSDLDARSVQVGPQACRPFSIHSNVCVGDMIAIIACSIAGVGFFFWGIHAIRKMRESPFDDEDEDKGKRARFPLPYQRLTSAFAEEPNGENDRADPFHVSVQNGVVQTPSLPDRVRTRLALSAPEEPFYRVSAPISTDAHYGQGSVTTPRMPPRAVEPSQRTSSRRSSRRVSPMRGGPYSERYEYGVNDEYLRRVSPSRETSSRRSKRPVSPMRGGPYGERYEYRVNDEYITGPSRETSRRSNRHVSPMQGGPYGKRYEYGVNDEYIRSVSSSRARSSPPHRTGTGDGSHQSMKRMDEDPVAYTYAY